MRSICATILSLIVLVQSWIPNANNELPKFVDLLIHFQEHNASEDLNFIEFWDLHYGWCSAADEHDKEEHHEGKFPFHGTQTSISSLVVFTPLVDLSILSTPNREILELFPELNITLQKGIKSVDIQPPILG